MRKGILAAAILGLIGLAAARPASADFSLNFGRPGFSLFSDDPVGPPPVYYEPPPVFYAPRVYYPKHYRKHWGHRGWHKHHWKHHSKHHHGRYHHRGWDDDD
jgi:hypothetical protein